MSDKKRKKILVIGNTNSIWTKIFVKDVLKKQYDVDVLDTTNNGVSDSFFYEIGTKTFRVTNYVGKEFFLSKLSNHTKMAISLRKICNDYDYINLQFVDLTYYRNLFLSGRLRKRLVLSFWGSDLFRKTPEDLKLLKTLYKTLGCRYITFDSEDLKLFFENKISRNYPGSVIMLPLPSLDYIDETRNCTDYCIDGITFPKSKTIIAIGYNSGEFQQHIKVIEALGSLDKNLKERVLIVLQMTYAGTEDYIKKCETTCSKMGFDYVVFRRFLDYKNTALLRNKVDLFINAQTTDAFSGSFCEYLYADTLVINASWLHYSEIDRYGISCVEYYSFDQLPEIVRRLLTNSNEYLIDTSNNREIIGILRSVNNCLDGWKKVFE